MRLGEMLIGQGLCSQADIDAALDYQRRNGGRLGTCLVALGALTIDQLVARLREQQRVESALDLCEHMLRGWERAYGTAHPNTNRARYNLARALMLAGRATDSLPHADAAFAGHIATLGPHHAWTLDAQRLVVAARLAVTRSDPSSAEMVPTAR